MTTSAFEYHAPTSVAEAAELLVKYGGEARLLAGGHSLVPLMKLRLVQPQVLIDLGKIPSMAYIQEKDGGLAIGAMTTYSQLASSDLVKSRALINRAKREGAWDDAGALKMLLNDDLLRERNSYARKVMREIEGRLKEPAQ